MAAARMRLVKMLSLVTLGLLGLVSLSQQQCLTPQDSVNYDGPLTAESLLQSELQFSIDLLHSVSSMQPGQNVFFSPTSIFKATILAYFISATHTENSLKQALHLASDKNKLDILGAYTLQNYYGKLRSINPGYQLDSANRLYVGKHLRVRPCFKKLFDEEILTVDFQNNARHILKKINCWVSDRTRRLIKDFLNSDQVTENTELVLVNAAYFRGFWESPFDKEDTNNRTFYLVDGTEAKTEMMSQKNNFKLIKDKSLGADVVELPYKGGDVSMLVVKPSKLSQYAIQELLGKINMESFQQLIKTLNSTKASSRYVSIPKFTIDKTLELIDVLSSLGAGDLFSETADLGSLVSKGNLRFSEAVHKAKLRVDEIGSEAAGATAIISNRIGFESFAADSPFMYLLYDKLSNVILFAGIYNSP